MCCTEKEKTMTVLDAFKEAFDPIPDGEVSKCGMLSLKDGSLLLVAPTLCIKNGYCYVFTHDWLHTPFPYDTPKLWRRTDTCRGPDIKGHQAYAFEGFFGPEYDEAIIE
jgi:hypothetical protein